jgi:hypothetical protein
MLQVSDYRLEPTECICNRHREECGCRECHEHKEHYWRDWKFYPPCEWCLLELSGWLAENTDYFELQRQYGRTA